MPPIVFTSPDTAQFSQVINILNKSSNIIAVVGAGMSTSCGIPAFRGGPEGIYSKYGKHVFDYVQVHSDQAIGRKYLQMVIEQKLNCLDWRYENDAANCCSVGYSYFFKEIGRIWTIEENLYSKYR
jgi:hypothetical protein